jgi:capsular polysaccharide biosynthesis protein
VRNVFSFGIKLTQTKLRLKITRVVVAALLGSLLVPVVGITAPQILPTAAANNANPGSIAITSTSNWGGMCGTGNNYLTLDIPSALALSGNVEYTLEAWVKTDALTNTNYTATGPALSVQGCAEVGTGAAVPGRYGDDTQGFEGWNQRAQRVDGGGGSHYMKTAANGGLVARCDGAATGCPKVEFPTGRWTHIALQKSIIGGNARLTAFVGGKVAQSATSINAPSSPLRIFKFGPFGDNASGKAFYGQMRLSNVALYPKDGTSAFAPSYDFSTTVSGGTVLALIKPQTNTTTSNAVDLTGNGTVLSTRVTGGSIAASSDFASPPPPAFSYSPASRTIFAGSPLPTTNIVSTGGDINSFSVSPALPSGLNLNTTTGEISGTPALSSPTTTYVVAGTQNSSGLQTTANISITVNKLVTSVSLALANSAVQVGVTNTLTATASTPGNVSFQTDQGVIPGCSSVATTTVSPFTASCPWVPTSSYFTMNATLTPTNTELATSTSTPSLTNIRGSLRLTSTGQTNYPGETQNRLATNNALRLNFPEGTGLVSSQSFTIETWVKVNNSILNIDLGAFYGDGFYADRGNSISITNSDSRIYGFLGGSVIGLTVPATPFASNNTWQNVVYQRKVVPGSPSEGYDAVFINGVLVTQFGTGGYTQGDPASQQKSIGVRIGPFNGVTQIGPTQVLSGVAAYPLTGFSPATTYSFGANTLALFQPSSTSCNSTAVAPSTVTASNGASTAACSTEYPVAPPSITSVVANSGPIAGLNTVVISGTNFIDLVANGLKFGATAIPLADYAINTFGTQITVKVPPGVLGTLDVTVQTAGGTTAISAGSKYSYVAAPTITSLSPAVGAEAGGIGVVITGTGFTNASAVTFGSGNATSFTVNSSTQITANFPAGIGSTFVKVTTPGGTSAENTASTFTYTSATSVTSVSPATGSTSGGTVVEISGTNFTSSSTVVFGTTAATNVSYNSTTGRLTATSPAGTGTVNVRVTTAGSQSATATANQFVYTATVAVSAISVGFGPTTGGTVVEISGTNFTSSSTVVFGTTAATNVSYNSETGRLTATSPAGTGTVNVRVTTGASPQSATATANQFIYYAHQQLQVFQELPAQMVAGLQSLSRVQILGLPQPLLSVRTMWLRPILRSTAQPKLQQLLQLVLAQLMCELQTKADHLQTLLLITLLISHYPQ